MQRACTFLVAMFLTLPMLATAAITLNDPAPAGPNVILSGSGGPANGPVELVVNGATASQTFADAAGDFVFAPTALTAGDEVRVQASYVWNFNTDGDFEGWVAGNPAHLGLQVTGGSLVCTTLSPASSPNINNPLSNFPDGEIDGSVYRVWEVRMKNNTDVNLLRFPYTPTGGSLVWRTDGSLDLAVATATSGFETYRFSDSLRTSWDGPITGIRMDMRNGSDPAGTVEIDYIRLNESVAYEFDIDGDFGYFNFFNVTSTTVSDGTLHMEATNTDPNFRFQNSTIPTSTYSIDQTDFTQLYIGGTWTNASVADFGFRYNSSYIKVNPGASVNTPTVWHMNLPGYTPTAGAAWSAAAVNLTTVRIDPHEGAAGTYDFDYVRLSPGSAFGPLDESAATLDTTPQWLQTSYADTLQVNDAYSMTLVDLVDFYENDGDTVQLSLSDHSGPGTGAWLAFGTGASSRTLAGSPATGDTGVHTWTLVASDGANFSTTSLELTVTNATPIWVAGPYSDALLINSTYNRTFVDGVDFQDADGGPVTLSIQDHVGAGDGAWLGFGTGASSLTLSGTPDVSDVGISTWTLVVDDGLASATTNIVLNISNGTPAWLAGPFTDAMLINAPYSLSLARGVEFDDPDGDPLTLSIEDYQGAGTGAWLTFGTGASSTTLSGTPGAADAGTGVWTLGVSDGSSLSTTTLTLDITNTAPVWLTTPSPDVLYAGDAFSLDFVEGVDFEDADGGPLTLSVQSHVGAGDGSWLTFGTGATSRTLSGTPDVVDAGVSTWTLSLSDSVNVTTTLLTLEVVDPDAVVTVVVDDDAGNDVAYVNGVGGNFTGTSALKDAVTAINADPSLRNNWEIQIIDTDGTSDTYSGTLLVQKDRMTIHQVPNGSVADAACLINAGADTDNVVLNVYTDDFTFSGLSADNPVVLEIPNDTAPNVGVAVQPGLANAALHNLTLTSGTTAGKLAMNLNGINVDLSGIWVDGVTNGLQIGSGCDATISSSTLAAAGYPIRLAGSSSAYIRSSRLVGDSQYIDLTSFERLELIDCEIDYSGASVGIFNPSMLANDTEILIVNPTLVGPTVTLPFNLGEQRTSITIAGNGPDDKADLTTIGEGKLLLRSRAANLTFTDCLIANEIECRGGIAPGDSMTTFTFERCYVSASVGEVQISGVERHINAENTIFDADNVDMALDLRQATSLTLVNLNHCTFMGAPSSDEFINASSSSATLTADYTIFDGSGAAWISEFGAISGSTNLVVSGSSGTFGDDTGLADTVTGDAVLSVSGRPLPGSAAIDAAIGSLLAIDYDGAQRPIGPESDLGAIEAPLDPGEPAAVENWVIYE